MKDYQSLNHTKWDCKYHVVFIPKRRKKQIYGSLRKYLGEMFHELARQKESRIVEGHLCSDHVHMCVSIPPKFAVECGRISQGQECDLDCEEFHSEKAKLCRRKLLGSRILRFNRGNG